MKLEIRVDLIVPFAQKEDAKALGARWDAQRRLWYAPPGTDLQGLDRWLPKDLPLSPAEGTILESDPDTIFEKGISLTDLLAQVKSVIDRGMPDAVWVRAEISELRGKNGHLYLGLTERNERGDVLANSKGVIWKSRAVGITAKFEQATGEGLKTDIKILCLVRVRFDALFGLDLMIEDVDPSYTLGDLAAKLRRIRERLTQAGLYDRNRSLTAPVDYVRVAVISPETSAGLGDFRRETDRLQDAGLCDFHFHRATFQGIDAPSSILTAVHEVLAAHRQQAFDALVIIRGGGSVTDLAWLNDLELAQLLCQVPIPVLTGIGHERDSTILDEIAHRRFDTPSKVAHHIATTIRDNALGAVTAMERIAAHVGRLISRQQTALQSQMDRVESGARSRLDQAASNHESAIRVVRTTASSQLRESGQALEFGYTRLTEGVENALSGVELDLERIMESIAHRSQRRLDSQAAEIDRLSSSLTLQTQAALDAAERDLDHLRTQVGREAIQWLSDSTGEVRSALDVLWAVTPTLLKTAARRIDELARMVVGLGPQATLGRGFALARDLEGNPITSRESAKQYQEFYLEFHDGNLPVTNNDHGEAGDQ